MIVGRSFFNQLICRTVELENGGNLDPLQRYKSANHNRAEYRRRSVRYPSCYPFARKMSALWGNALLAAR